MAASIQHGEGILTNAEGAVTIDGGIRSHDGEVGGVAHERCPVVELSPLVKLRSNRYRRRRIDDSDLR